MRPRNNSRSRRASASMVIGLTGAGIGLVVPGCQWSQPGILAVGGGGIDYDKAGNTMDEVAKQLEKFGSVSVSSPMLAPVDTAGFEFSVEKKANDYYNDARNDVSGRAAAAFSSSRQSGFGLSLSGDISASILADIQQSLYERNVSKHLEQRRAVESAADAAARQRLDKLPENASEADRDQAQSEAAALKGKMLADAGYGTAPTPPTPIDPSTLPKVTEGLAPTADTAAAKLVALPGVLGLLGEDAPIQLENDQALLKAARDTAIEGVLGLLGEPKKLSFADKKVMLGVAMVAVEPGWQTKENYAADVSVLCSYDYAPAREERIRTFVNQVIISNNEEMMKELGKVSSIGPTKIDGIKSVYNSAKLWVDVAQRANPVIKILNEQSDRFSVARQKVRDGKADAALKAKVGAASKLLDALEQYKGVIEGATAVAADPSSGLGKQELPKIPKDFADPVNEAVDVLRFGFSTDEGKVEQADAQGKQDKAAGGAVVAAPAAGPGGDRKPDGEKSATAAPAPPPPPPLPPDLIRQMKAASDVQSFVSSAATLTPQRSSVGVLASASSLVAGESALPANPTVAAVSPMMNGDTLELSSSFRQSRERALRIAVALRYLGFGGEAEAFDKYAENLGRDVATRSVLPTMSVYSHSGGMFGFQIGPRLKPLEVAALNRKNASVTDTKLQLDRQSFPVLVLIGMDERDLILHFGYRDGQYQLLEPAIKFSQSSRWVPLSAGTSQARWSERDRLGVAKQFAQTLSELPMTADELENAREAKTKADAALVHAANKSMFPVKDADVPSLIWARDFLLESRERKLIAKADQGTVREFSSAVSDLRLNDKGDEWAVKSRKVIPDVRTILDYALQARVGQTPKPVDQYLRDRTQMLNYHAFGSSNTQDIPLKVVLPDAAKPPTPPTIAKIVPAVIRLDGGVSATSQPQKVVLLGANLKSVAEDKITIRMSGVTGASTSTTGNKATKVGETGIEIELAVAPKDTPASVWFEVPYTLGNETKTLVTQPVQVLPPPSKLEIEFKDSKKGTRTLTIPTAAPADIVKSVVGEAPKKKEDEKKDDKPGGGKTSVDMKLDMDIKALQARTPTTKPSRRY